MITHFLTYNSISRSFFFLCLWLESSCLNQWQWQNITPWIFDGISCWNFLCLQGVLHVCECKTPRKTVLNTPKRDQNFYIILLILFKKKKLSKLSHTLTYTSQTHTHKKSKKKLNGTRTKNKFSRKFNYTDCNIHLNVSPPGKTTDKQTTWVSLLRTRGHKNRK